jgi:PAS domain S-box-containing protein
MTPASSRKLSDVDLRDSIGIVTAVLDVIKALVVVLDQEARIVLFNHTCQACTGYSFEEARGKRLWDLLPPEETDAVRQTFQELLAGRFPNKHQNHWVAKDGKRKLIAWSNSAVVDAGGSVKYVIGTGIDLSELGEDDRFIS